jgi:hypothetical protein
MRRTCLLTVACVVVPLFAGAALPDAVAAQDTTAAAAAAKKKPKGRANLITEEEIAAGGTFQNAMEIVQRLRPAMLRVRSGGAQSGGSSGQDVGATEMSVFLDNQRLGGVEVLREIMLSQLKEIRYLSPSDATTLFGTGHQAGAIQVVGKR